MSDQFSLVPLEFWPFGMGIEGDFGSPCQRLGLIIPKEAVWIAVRNPSRKTPDGFEDTSLNYWMKGMGIGINFGMWLIPSVLRRSCCFCPVVGDVVVFVSPGLGQKPSVSEHKSSELGKPAVSKHKRTMSRRKMELFEITHG